MAEFDSGKAVKLILAMREQIDNLTLIVEEFDAMVGGKATIADKLHAFVEHWNDLWLGEYKEKFVWSHAKDYAQIKRLLKTLKLGELKARATSYIKNKDPFYANKRHPFGMFVTTINSHAGAAAVESIANEVQKTKQRSEAMR